MATGERTPYCTLNLLPTGSENGTNDGTLGFANEETGICARGNEWMVFQYLQWSITHTTNTYDTKLPVFADVYPVHPYQHMCRCRGSQVRQTNRKVQGLHLQILYGAISVVLLLELFSELDRREAEHQIY